MTNKIKIIAIAVLTIFSIATSGLKAQDKTTFSIETDPSTFVFKGYALHLRIKPENSKQLVIGVGTYAIDLPSLMVDINPKNKEKGWDVRINSAYSFFGEYYFEEANHKWFVGLQAGVQNYKNSNSNIPNKETKYSNLLLMPSIGYNWQPFEFPLYFKPWFGLGYTTKISGSNTIANLEYDISPLIPFVTLHIGYTF
ncbi:MAG: hypothetical protein FD122_3610 [Stygiobacter sp.]|nr:MAG: hypothetical protein FD122_3610 [Stygiobacter sp.]KAF0211629.1 MAG: hypothetical protein FD178_3389 [Ignavibacteria bacterium]